MPYKDPEKARKNAHELYLKNRESVIEKSRIWKLQNPERALENYRKWYAEKAGEKSEYKRQWRVDNLDRERKKDRRRYKEDPSRAERNKVWAEKNPEKVREYGRRHSRKYRALQKKNSVEPIASDFYDRKLVECGHRCIYCKIDLHQPEVTTEWDHVVPISKGGAHAEHNLVPACLKCNRGKCARDVEEFLRCQRLSRTKVRSLDLVYLNLSGFQN